MQLPLPQLARFRPITRWALMGYAALTIVLYFLMAPLTVIGFIDKAIEVAVIALLLDDAYLARSQPSGEAPGARTTGS